MQDSVLYLPGLKMVESSHMLGQQFEQYHWESKPAPSTTSSYGLVQAYGIRNMKFHSLAYKAYGFYAVHCLGW